MGGLAAAIPYIPLIKAGIDIVSNVASKNQEDKSREQALRQLKATQREEMRAAQENADADRARIAAEAEIADDQRRDSLRRAVARQRAQFGASGVSPASGSGQAVLLGLFEESEEDLAERERIDNLRLSAIGQGLEQQRRANILERTQLQERKKLEGLGANISRFGKVINLGLNAAKLN